MSTALLRSLGAMLPALVVHIAVPSTSQIGEWRELSAISAPKEGLEDKFDALCTSTPNILHQRALQHVIDTGIGGSLLGPVSDVSTEPDAPSGSESAIVGQDRDDSKAVVVVLLARSPGGLQLAKEVARLCVSHAPVGQTVTANEVQERLGPDARIDDAAGRVAFSEVVAEILLSKPSAAIVLDDTAFAAVPGALTTLHTCWDVRGKLTGPRLGETTCHQSTFVVVVDESSDNPEASATTQEAKMNCDPRGECSSYDKHLVAAKEWFSRHVLPPSREAAEVEAQALLRRLSDVVVFV